MWEKAYIPGSKPDGKPIISVLAKRSYFISRGKVELASEQAPLVQNDEFENPDQMIYSEVIAETDYIPYKPFTDFVVLGKVYTPEQKQAYYLDSSVRIGPLQKVVRVFGNRTVEAKTLRGLVISDPQPFTEMELGYKNAYGGVARSKDNTLYSYYPNPIGKGFTLKGGFEDPTQIQLPNLEDPESPLTSDNLVLSKPELWVDAPKPASFGWTKRSFYPRYTYAGVMPEQLEGVANQYKELQGNGSANIQIPRMDYRVYQGASDGLWGALLKGNEQVQLKYFDARYPTYDFSLPNDLPKMTLDIGDGPTLLEPVLHTVVIDMNKKMLYLVWRGCLEYGGIEALAKMNGPIADVKN